MPYPILQSQPLLRPTSRRGELTFWSGRPWRPDSSLKTRTRTKVILIIAKQQKKKKKNHRRHSEQYPAGEIYFGGCRSVAPFRIGLVSVTENSIPERDRSRNETRWHLNGPFHFITVPSEEIYGVAFLASKHLLKLYSIALVLAIRHSSSPLVGRYVDRSIWYDRKN